jgi:hypothetical protein
VIVGIFGLVVALAASVLAYLSWRAAATANEIAARALKLAEQEHTIAAQERAARARFEIQLSIAGQEVASDGTLRIGGSGGQLRLRIAIRNVGDRTTGRGKVDVTFSPITNDSYVRWSDPGGRVLPDLTARGARVEDGIRLSRDLEPLGQDLEETWYATFMVDVPPPGRPAHDYSLAVAVAADGAAAARAALPLFVSSG